MTNIRIIFSLLLSHLILVSPAIADESRIYVYVEGVKSNATSVGEPLIVRQDEASIDFKVKVNFRKYYDDVWPEGRMELIDNNKTVSSALCSNYPGNETLMEGDDKLLVFYCPRLRLFGISTESPILRFTYTSKIEKVVYERKIERNMIPSVFGGVNQSSLSRKGNFLVSASIWAKLQGNSLDPTKAKLDICVLKTCRAVGFTIDNFTNDGYFILSGKLSWKLQNEQIAFIRDSKTLEYQIFYNNVPISDFNNRTPRTFFVKAEPAPEPKTSLRTTVKAQRVATLGALVKVTGTVIGKGSANCSVHFTPSRAPGIYSGGGYKSPSKNIAAGNSHTFQFTMGAKFQGTWGALLNCRDAKNGAYIPTEIALIVQR